MKHDCVSCYGLMLRFSAPRLQTPSKELKNGCRHTPGFSISSTHSQSIFYRSELARADWLDKLAFRAIERIREENRKKLGTSHLDLIVELPSFEHPVAYQELGAPLLSQPLSATNELVKVYDPEVGRQNPSEEKQLKLARGVNRGLIDKDLKVRVPAS
jgi:hypothetical protein